MLFSGCCSSRNKRASKQVRGRQQSQKPPLSPLRRMWYPFLGKPRSQEMWGLETALVERSSALIQMHLYFSIISRALPMFTAWGLFFSLLLSCQQYVLRAGASAVHWHGSLTLQLDLALLLHLGSALCLTSSLMLTCVADWEVDA